MEKRSLTTSLLFFLCVIFIPEVNSLLLNGDGVVKPDDPYVYFKQTLVLWCNLTNPQVREKSTSMYFVFDNEIIPKQYVHIINTRSIQLRYPVSVEKFGCSSKHKYHNFVCMLNRSSSDPIPLDHQLVRVNYEPQPVTDFECRVYNWENMTCTWNLATPYCNYDDIEVSLYWTIINQGQYDCPNLTKTSCSWLQSGNMLFPDMLYHMVVKVKNKYYNNTKSIPVTSDNFKIYTKNIVQPAPVEHFTVIRDENNSSCLMAKWTHTLKHRQRQYKVEIKSEYEEIPQMMLFDSLKPEYHICNLRAYTLYTISVSNMPMSVDGRTSIGYWSDSVETVRRTSQDIPGAAPILCPGCFTEKICEEENCQRNIKIYWKPVEKTYQNGVIDGYKIETLSEVDGITTTYLVNDGSQTSYSLSLITNNKYMVKITAKTSKGYSKHGSSIVIPSTHDAPALINNLIIEAVNTTNTKLYEVIWSDEHDDDDHNYTLYYCQRFDIPECRGRISWLQLSPHKKQAFLNLEFDEQQQSRYQIGISIQTMKEGYPQSSGILWNKCIYIKDTKPLFAPPNVRFLDLQPDRALLIEWNKLDCLDNTAYIKEYLIQVCPVSKRNGDCTGDKYNITVNNDLTSYRIEDLTPFTMYKIRLRAVSSSGLGPASPSISSQVTDSSLKTSEIAGIVIGALFVLALMLFAVFRCIRCAKEEKRKCENIRISTNTFLPETIINPLSKPNQNGHFRNRPLPPTPSVLQDLDSRTPTKDFSDSGFVPEEIPAEYEPIGPVRTAPSQRNNNSITSETQLINHMETSDDHNHHHRSNDTSPYAISDITKGPCVTSNSCCDDVCECENNSAPVDSYSKVVGVSDSGCSETTEQQINNVDFNNLNDPIRSQSVQTIGFVLQQNVPNQRLKRPNTITCPRLNNRRPVPMIAPTENSDSSDDSCRNYVPNDVISSPIHENHPIVCELVSPSGDIHNTQTLLIRRLDPRRPLSDYLHQLPMEYFQDQNQDGPTTEL